MNLPEHPTWHAAAPCRGHLELFYPPKGAAADLAYAVARRFCGRCPFIVECRIEGDLHEDVPNEVFGMRGGETPAERLRRRRPAQLAVKAADVVAVTVSAVSP